MGESIYPHSLYVIGNYETNFKLLSRWYRCLTVLHRMYPNISDLYWHWHSAKGSLLHIWWECPSVHDFWSMVLQFYTQATGVIVPNMPQITLLSILPGSYKSVKKGLFRHWLTAARAVIPRYWRLVHAPPLIEWVMEMLLSCELDTYNVVKFGSLGNCSGNPLKCKIYIRVGCKIETGPELKRVRRV